MMMDLAAFTSALQLMKEVIQFLMQVKDLLPTDPKRQGVERRLIEAERSLQMAEAQVAKALGYPLCRCTWPPQIMLSKGLKGQDEIFGCPRCGGGFPPPIPDLPNSGGGTP
jgi:hypothetical protein